MGDESEDSMIEPLFLVKGSSLLRLDLRFERVSFFWNANLLSSEIEAVRSSLPVPLSEPYCVLEGGGCKHAIISLYYYLL